MSISYETICRSRPNEHGKAIVFNPRDVEKWSGIKIGCCPRKAILGDQLRVLSYMSAAIASGWASGTIALKRAGYFSYFKASAHPTAFLPQFLSVCLACLFGRRLCCQRRRRHKHHQHQRGGGGGGGGGSVSRLEAR
jgi:hypothetical protein